MEEPENMENYVGEIKISFEYQCHENNDFVTGSKLPRTSSLCLSGAALSANYTFENTNICNGLIGAEILPTWDSPKSFHRVPSSPNLPNFDFLSSSFQSSMSNLSCGLSSPSDSPEYDSGFLKSMSLPCRSEGFLNAMEVEVVGGAAGEDRVQAVCSEENGWVFCAIYDGFNGRDAADFLAGTLYETIIYYFNLSESDLEQEFGSSGSFDRKGPSPRLEGIKIPVRSNSGKHPDHGNEVVRHKRERYGESFRQRVVNSLQRALHQAENDFLFMVEQEMKRRPDLVSIGSCVLVVLLHGLDLYTMDLGDSRAVLATYDDDDDENLKAVQLTESHTLDNKVEKEQLIQDHPDDPQTIGIGGVYKSLLRKSLSRKVEICTEICGEGICRHPQSQTIVGGRVKGKLKVTRAFGVGYLKKKKLNDALMGILRVRNLISPPYISTEPSMNVHRITKSDCFVIVASDGLFDFYTNDEAMKLVESYILTNPFGEPAKYLLEQLVIKAAFSAGVSTEELMSIPAGTRRKYHDDVSVVVIILGSDLRTSKASTFL